MTTTTQIGYLERAYLQDDYLIGFANYAMGTQVKMIIQDRLHVVANQVNQQIADSRHVVAGQVSRLILDRLHTFAAQSDQRIDSSHTFACQVGLSVTETTHVFRGQASSQIADFPHTTSAQNKMRIDAQHPNQTQVNRTLDAIQKIKHFNVRRGNVFHQIAADDAGYLVLPYLTTEYLGAVINGRIRTQVSRFLNKQHILASQVQRVIAAQHRWRSQAQMRIDAVHSFKSQVAFAHGYIFGSQVNVSLYNPTSLRVLLDFPSRGTGDGLNWSASTTAPGDFSVNNLNTDIVEQVWRGEPGFRTAILTCDSQVPQGIFVDTLAILGHNFTRNASVQLQGSTDPGFGAPGFTLDMPWKLNNMFYVAQTLPTESFRYWRFIINDTDNPADLQVGVIVFGSAIVVQGEDIVDQVQKASVHFADKVLTEGFTNVSNDRALKYKVAVSFKNLDYHAGNYAKLTRVFETARTSLKSLWIPTPQYPERFAVFGKLAELPVESHNSKGIDADYIDFQLNIDESL